MEIDRETVLPAIGVIIGWLLNELSQVFKSRHEAKRLINKSLYSLLDLSLMLNYKKNLLKSAFKSNKLTGSQFDLLVMLFDDRKFNSEEFKSNLFQTITNLAEIDPILCQGLMLSYESVNLFGKIERSNTHSISERSDIELKFKTLEVFTKQLDILTRKLITKHSLLMRIRYELYKRKNLGDEKVSWDPLFKEQH